MSHPPLRQVELPEVLHALADPVRLEIVRDLANSGECACGELQTRVSRSTLSHHLKVLREAGLTQVRPDGTQRRISLRRDELDERFPELLDSVLGCS